MAPLIHELSSVKLSFLSMTTLSNLNTLKSFMSELTTDDFLAYIVTLSVNKFLACCLVKVWSVCYYLSASRLHYTVSVY